MKLFRPQQLSTVVLLFILAIVLGNFVFDHIPHGAPYPGTLTKCDNLTVLFDQKRKRCQQSAVTVRNYGWPFVAIKRIEQGADPQDRRLRSLPILARASTGYLYISLNSGLLLGMALAGYIAYRRYGSSLYKSPSAIDTPIITSSDLLGEGNLQSLNQGVIAGYHYNLLTNSKGRIMLFVTLPKNTNMHFVATGTKSKDSLPLNERIQSHFLKPVVLEGTFPKDFRLYSPPNRQREIRQIFEPVTMTYVMDFCRAYQIELFNDMFYIAQAAVAYDKTDKTTIVEDTEKLLTRLGRLFDRLSRES